VGELGPAEPSPNSRTGIRGRVGEISEKVAGEVCADMIRRIYVVIAWGADANILGRRFLGMVDSSVEPVASDMVSLAS